MKFSKFQSFEIECYAKARLYYVIGNCESRFGSLERQCVGEFKTREAAENFVRVLNAEHKLVPKGESK